MERFLDYDTGTNKVTFTPQANNTVYTYNVTVYEGDTLKYAGSFNFSCNYYYQLYRCSDGVVFYTNVPFLEENQVYYSGDDYYYFNGASGEYFTPPENTILDLLLHTGPYIDCNTEATFTYNFSTNFNS